MGGIYTTHKYTSWDNPKNILSSFNQSIFCDKVASFK